MNIFLFYCFCLILIWENVSGDDGCGAVRQMELTNGNLQSQENLEQPVPLVIIQHTGTDGCDTDKKCLELIRSIQNIDMDVQDDSSFRPSFWVGGKGEIYEGTGWTMVGSHTYGYDNFSIGIVFIGNYDEETPKTEQLDAVKSLLECGVQRGYITLDYDMLAESQVTNTTSPGEYLYQEIQEWPAWIDTPNGISSEFLEENYKACRVVSRREWGARTPEYQDDFTRVPVVVIIQHTNTSMCLTDDECAEQVRSIQNKDMDELGKQDIGSMFLIGGNGKVYEGTGWGVMGSHTPDYDNISIGISFIGNYNEDMPKSEQVEALESLIDCGVQRGHILPEFDLYGQAQLFNTTSPGLYLMYEILQLPSWIDTTDPDFSGETREVCRLITRKMWDARIPDYWDYFAGLPVTVIIHHTKTPACESHKECVEQLRSIQNKDMDELDKWDIGLSFYIGGNGKIYEGTGWHRVGSHTYGFNPISIGVSFIGDYDFQEPTDEQLEALRNLLSCGVERGYLNPQHSLYGHLDLGEFPGGGAWRVREKIEEWPEYRRTRGVGYELYLHSNSFSLYPTMFSYVFLRLIGENE